MSKKVTSVHESFELKNSLSEGGLYFSDDYPDLAIRTADLSFAGCSSLNSEDEPAEAFVSCLRIELSYLSRCGIESVNPQFFVTSEQSQNNRNMSIGMVCERLYGKELEEMITEEDEDAINLYAQTLLSLTSYYNNAYHRKVKPFSDIAPSHQFTFADGRLVLHDISLIEHFSRREKNPNNREHMLKREKIDGVLDGLKHIAIGLGEIALQTTSHQRRDIVEFASAAYLKIKNKDADLLAAVSRIHPETILILDLMAASKADPDVLAIIPRIYKLN
jgi:hypothetical protein